MHYLQLNLSERKMKMSMTKINVLLETAVEIGIIVFSAKLLVQTKFLVESKTSVVYFTLKARFNICPTFVQLLVKSVAQTYPINGGSDRFFVSCLVPFLYKERKK